MANLTKQHFERLARIAALVTLDIERHRVTSELIALCVDLNPRFDGARFRAAVEAENAGECMPGPVSGRAASRLAQLYS